MGVVEVIDVEGSGQVVWGMSGCMSVADLLGWGDLSLVGGVKWAESIDNREGMG